MRIFSTLYDWCLLKAKSRQAPWWLGVLSFSESSFFPIPPDVMLAPMVLATPGRSVQLALLTTIMSVLGGIFGYAIGSLAFDQFGLPLLEFYGIMDRFDLLRRWFDSYGVWVVLMAGFTPIPYKLFTIASGALSMVLIPFVIASFVGRGARFFLVAMLIAWGGERLQSSLRKYVDRIGWITLAVVVVGLAAYFTVRH